MKSRFMVLAVCAIGFLFVAQFAMAIDKIEGPWMWIIAATEANLGGAASTDVDSIDTEADVEWTEGKI